MQIKKYILSSICICLLLCLTVSAHPGRTDSSGGHTDHSTGEYHYHHGYEAHSHYDMDGDGDLDCPYDFDDKTGQNSGSNTSSNSSYSNGYANGKSDGYNAGYDDGYDDGAREAEAVLETEKTAAIKAERDRVYTLCALYGIPLVAFLTYLVVRRKQRKETHVLQKQISTLQSDLARERNNTILESLFPNSNDIPVIPNNVSLSVKCIPIIGTTYKYRPYGDYTVYTTQNGNKYHSRFNCGNARKPLHYFDVISDLEPCRNCVSHGQYPKEIPRWYQELSNGNFVISHPATAHNDNKQFSQPQKQKATTQTVNPSGVIPVESSFINSVEYCDSLDY